MKNWKLNVTKTIGGKSFIFRDEVSSYPHPTEAALKTSFISLLNLFAATNDIEYLRAIKSVVEIAGNDNLLTYPNNSLCPF
jgi:hypothetical protein